MQSTCAVGANDAMREKTQKDNLKQITTNNNNDNN